MIRREMFVTAALVAALAVPVVCRAQDPAPQTIRVGATLFYDYTYTREPQTTDADGNAISPSAFNVARAYLNVTGRVSDVVSFRITPDIRRQTGTGGSLDGSLVFRLKYGYAQLNLDQWLTSGAEVRAGIIPTLLISAEESIYRYRFQGTLFVERDGGLSSADAGVSFQTNLPSGYGNVQAGIFNGEGYSKAEANDQKSLQFRATVRPLPASDTALSGLRVIAFYNADSYVRDAERRRFAAALLFEHDRLNAGFDWLEGSDRTSSTSDAVRSRGVSFFVTPFFQEKGSGWEGLIRFDQHDPDRDSPGTSRRWITGLAYWLPHPGGSATAAVLFDYEQVTFDGFVTPRPRQQRIAVHGLVNF